MIDEQLHRSVISAARKILADEEVGLSKGQLAEAISDERPFSSDKHNRDQQLRVILNIIENYIGSGLLLEKDGNISCLSEPLAFLIEHGFHKIHSLPISDGDQRHSFDHSEYRNVYLYTMSYADGKWSFCLATHRTAEESVFVNTVVDGLRKLPGYEPNKVWG